MSSADDCRLFAISGIPELTQRIPIAHGVTLIPWLDNVDPQSLIQYPPIDLPGYRVHADDVSGVRAFLETSQPEDPERDPPPWLQAAFVTSSLQLIGYHNVRSPFALPLTHDEYADMTQTAIERVRLQAWREEGPLPRESFFQERGKRGRIQKSCDSSQMNEPRVTSAVWCATASF